MTTAPDGKGRSTSGGSGPILDRPFHFVVVFWGARFADYLVEYCLPSLLSPGNIPALTTRQTSKFLIATRPEDWQALRETAIFRELQTHILPVFIEIPPCPPGRPATEHMGLGHKLACSMAFAESAYAVLLTPDSMLSDGTVARLQDRAAAGTEIVLAVALRFGEEPFLGKLREIGGLAGVRGRDGATPLVISGRDMVRAAVNGFHSESLRYEWDAPSFPPSFPDVPAAAWWRVPHEDGIVLHSLSWAPLLVDYGALRRHDTSTFDTWTLDGDYIFKNFGRSGAMHVVTDSDEMFIASWGPLAERPADLKARCRFGELGKGALFRFAFHGPVFDPLKRQIFFTTVRWHALPIGARWSALEERSMQAILAYVRPPGEEPSSFRWRLWTINLYGVAMLEMLARLRKPVAEWRIRNRHRIALLLRGDGAALKWLWWTVRKAIAGLSGRRYDVSKPRLPEE